MTIHVRSGQMNIHREGLRVLAEAFDFAQCDDAQLSVQTKVRLYKAGPDPGCADSASDYTQADFTGYTQVAISPGEDACDGILEIGRDANGVLIFVIDQQVWTAGDPLTLPNTVAGMYVLLSSAAFVDQLFMTLPFATAVEVGTAGDIVKVSGYGLLDCQMVPVA